jgi:hypothetical protein
MIDDVVRTFARAMSKEVPFPNGCVCSESSLCAYTCAGHESLFQDFLAEFQPRVVRAIQREQRKADKIYRMPPGQRARGRKL